MCCTLLKGQIALVLRVSVAHRWLVMKLVAIWFNINHYLFKFHLICIQHVILVFFSLRNEIVDFCFEIYSKG